jgi:hypothetical protein
MWRFFEPKHVGAKRGTPVGGLHPNSLLRSEVERLYNQITTSPRSLVIAAGNYALWALAGVGGTEVLRQSNNRSIPPELQTEAPTGITSWRGSMLFMLQDRFAKEPRHGKTPLLPILHPAAIMRDWTQRAVTVHDLRARIPMALAADWTPSYPPVMLAPPTYNEVLNRLRLWLTRADSGTTLYLAEDVETKVGLITCLGFADSPHYAICIPFVRRCSDGTLDSFWTTEQECTILQLLNRVNSHPSINIIGQNFIYDTQYIEHWTGIAPKLSHDTMLVQNVLFPGTPKDLGYLSSLHCRYHRYWKEDSKEWDGKGSIEQLWRYNCEDCLRTWEIAASQRQVITQLQQEPQVALKMKVNDLCLRMMHRGVRIDLSRRGAMSFELQQALIELEHELLTIIPQDWITTKSKKMWYRSGTQTKFVFSELLGFQLPKHRKTGRPTSGKEGRQQLEKRYPEYTGLFKRLRLHASAANAHGVINSGLDPDGRMRCSFNPGGTETHRLSSSTNAFGRGTNLQNLTKGHEDE